MSTTTDTLILTTAAETKGCVFNKEVTVTLNANVKAPLMESEQTEQRKSVDIVCVIDKSGSMSGTPLELVKETLNFMVGQLKDGDRLSIVTFGDEASLVFPLTNMTEEGKTKASGDIRAIRTDGWTNLSGGIMKGLDQLAQRPASEAAAVSSILVFTDGEANRGITGVDELVKATVNRLDGINSAISLHTFGFSVNHNPELLTKLAEAANGVFYYLPSADRIAEVFADCLGGLLSVVALNVVLEATVEYSGAQIVKVHTPFSIRQLTPGTHLAISIGQMYSEQERDILFDVKLPAVDATDLDAKVIKFKLSSVNRQEQNVETIAFATIDRATEDSATVKEVNQEVKKQKARVETAEVMKEALQLKSAGRTSEAAKKLTEAKVQMQSAGFGTYATQLDTAETEIQGSNSGYLWTNMRSHAAQSSSAQAPMMPSASSAQGPSADVHGYSNSIQRKMKAAAPRSKASVDPSPPQAYASAPLAPYGNYPAVPQQYQLPQQAQQAQQAPQAPLQDLA